MRCPRCGATKSRVIETRESETATRRRRQCKACGLRFTTYERPQFSRLVIQAASGGQRNFTRRWLAHALEATGVELPEPELRKLAAETEAQLRATGGRIFSTEDVGATAARVAHRVAARAGWDATLSRLPDAAEVTAALEASMPARPKGPAQLPLPLDR